MSEENEKIHNEWKNAGCTAVLLVAVFFLLTFIESFSGSGHSGGIRGTLSADWHHAKCLVKFCDEDGRCPVWSHTYSKCYMLDEKEGEYLKEFEESKAKKGMFELYMLEVKGRKI